VAVTRLPLINMLINMKNKPLLELPELYGNKAFADVFLITAGLIEQSLMQGGAQPGKDYTVIDLYTLAQPFVLSRYQKRELTDCL